MALNIAYCDAAEFFLKTWTWDLLTLVQELLDMLFTWLQAPNNTREVHGLLDQGETETRVFITRSDQNKHKGMVCKLLYKGYTRLKLTHSPKNNDIFVNPFTDLFNLLLLL